MLLGAGLSMVGDLGVTTISDAVHLDVVAASTVGNGADTNIRLTMTVRKAGE
jgi:diaminohydroxyphosphoribosylaminopyrimidine deaminase/5-amino-6-(5-phosphoribosylamino)uracil reductase